MRGRDARAAPSCCWPSEPCVAAAQAIQVTPLVRDGRVYVSFQLSDAFDNEDIRAAIHSGLTITFVYDVELRRGAAAWLDRTIDSSTVSAGVRYDNLARRYHVTLSADGRLEETRTLDREEPGARMAHPVRSAGPVQQRPARAERRVLRPRARPHHAAQRLVRLAVAGDRRRRPGEIHLSPLSGACRRRTRCQNRQNCQESPGFGNLTLLAFPAMTDGHHPA